MTNVTDLNAFAAKRKKPCISLGRALPETAYRERARRLLLNWYEEHKDLGSDFIVSELEGLIVCAQVDGEKS